MQDMIEISLKNVSPTRLAIILTAVNFFVGRDFGTFHDMLWNSGDDFWGYDRLSGRMPLNAVIDDIVAASRSPWNEIPRVSKMDFQKSIDEMLAKNWPEDRANKTFDYYDYQRRNREMVKESPAYRAETTYMKGERSRRDNGKSRFKVRKLWAKRAA